MSVTTNTVTLQWKPPHTTNGVITHYSVQYGETVIDNFGKYMLNAWMGTIEGLPPETEYVLELKAYTKVGAGPPADVTVTTRRLLKVIYMFIQYVRL